MQSIINMLELIKKQALVIVPIAAVLIAVGAWELVVRVNNIPHFTLPSPSLITKTIISDWADLLPAMWLTLKITFFALALAVFGGIALAAAFTLSRWVEISFFPFAVILQVTPIIAIAPLIQIYVPSTSVSVLICAWLVAFFPILSNTVVGLRSADQNLKDLFKLYGASSWQGFRYLLVPSALPYFMAGLKIAGGLSLIGAVVAEFTVGIQGAKSGLASIILEASFRSNTPRMFAALVLIALTGILIFLAMNLISKLALGKWHESELKREL
jgi:NitT/TauT family transport system permease protein